MSAYKDALTEAMNNLAKNPKVLFIGQAVAVPGTAIRTTLEEVSPDSLLELPVEEDFQMGVAIGIAMSGMLPVSIFPRWNFLLLATNQIVNHLDKLRELSRSAIPPKVIIRTAIGSSTPLHPGPQHTGDYTEAFKLMCPNLNIVRLDDASMVIPEYAQAAERIDGVSTVLVEWGDKY